MTVAQGQSVDRAFVMADAAMSLEEFNTSLSRSVEGTHIYAIEAPVRERAEIAPLGLGERDPLDELFAATETPQQNIAAITEVERDHARRLSPRELQAVIEGPNNLVTSVEVV